MPKSPIPIKEEDLTTRELLLKLNKRLAAAALMSVGAVTAMAFSIAAMMPLKEAKPFIVEVAKDGSASVPLQTDAVAYNPTEESITFFLKRWVADAFTINQYNTTSLLDPRARLFLRGSNALGAYSDFIASDGKFVQMAKNPQMTRDVKILGTTRVAGTNNGFIFDTLLSTRVSGDLRETRRLVTIYYEVFTQRERRDVEANPLGIYVIDFKVGHADAVPIPSKAVSASTNN